MYCRSFVIRFTAGGTGRGRSNKYAVIQLSDTAEKTSPFRSSRGNEMVATRMLQLQSEEVSGEECREGRRRGKCGEEWVKGREGRSYSCLSF